MFQIRNENKVKLQRKPELTLNILVIWWNTAVSCEKKTT